jgi:hypothetical protein
MYHFYSGIYNNVVKYDRRFHYTPAAKVVGPFCGNAANLHLIKDREAAMHWARWAPGQMGTGHTMIDLGRGETFMSSRLWCGSLGPRSRCSGSTAMVPSSNGLHERLVAGRTVGRNAFDLFDGSRPAARHGNGSTFAGQVDTSHSHKPRGGRDHRAVRAEFLSS